MEHSNFGPATFVISLTAFKSDGTLDTQAQAAHFERLRRSGIGVYVGGAGSGEGHALTLDEIAEVTRIAVATLKGHVPVRAMGREPRTADQMIELIELVTSLGVDAVQVYSLDAGHAYLPNQREQEAYFRDVLSAISVPVVLSTHHYSGYLLAPTLIRDLVSDFPNIVGITCTAPDIRYTADVIDAVAGRSQILTGGPIQGLTAMAMGADGFATSEANIVPGLAVQIFDAYRAGDLAETFRLYRRFMQVYRLSSKFGAITGVKAALKFLGLPGGEPRRPRLPLTDEEYQWFSKQLQDLKLDSSELSSPD